MRLRSLSGLLGALLLGALAAQPTTVAAQTRGDSMVTIAAGTAAEHQVPMSEPGHTIEKKLGPADIIMPHITDSHEIELPCFNHEWACAWQLPTWKFAVAGHTIDISPTKHVFFMALAALLVALFLIWTAQSHQRHSHEVGRPKGTAAGLEAVILYLRNEVFMPVLGHGGERYVPFALTLFFFILFCNLFGLIPYGSTPTGNLGVTATLATITFIVVEVAGMRALGKGYINTVVYWNHDLPIVLRILLAIIMTPVEIIGKFTKPFALTVRLFANMIAGHVIILALIGLIFMFGWVIFIGPIAMATGIMLLEILVAFIQAFIFSLLAAVFIGQIRASHH